MEDQNSMYEARQRWRRRRHENLIEMGVSWKDCGGNKDDDGDWSTVTVMGSSSNNASSSNKRDSNKRISALAEKVTGKRPKVDSISDDDEDSIMDINSGGLKMEGSEFRMDFTDDILHKIMSFLNRVDLCRAAGVSKQWRAATNHKDFWRCLNFRNSKISAARFSALSRQYPHVVKLNIFGGPNLHLLAEKAINLLRNLETLVLGRGRLNLAFFHALGGCPDLRSLSIVDANLGKGRQKIAVCHNRLQNLRIVKCRAFNISVSCPQIEVLSVKNSDMYHLVLNCPKLHELDLGSVVLSDEGIRLAAKSCPLLTSLDLSNCTYVTEETLREIALTCAHLRILNASYCPRISFQSVLLPELTVLKLNNCPSIVSASMRAISQSFALEVLELDNCEALTSVSLNLQYLQTLRLDRCIKIVNLSLESHMLSSITVSSCPSLRCINLTSNSLQKLGLQQLENLNTLSLQCQSLQTVDLTGNKLLTDFVCNVFSDGGGCPAVRSLVLDNCESLTTVKLQSTSLVRLSLVGCRAMIGLELACPNLEQVCVDDYDNLERALFCPVGFESLNLGICPKLSTLQIEAFQLEVLELNAYGSLSEISINCPRLMSLDASFCCQLTDSCMDAITAPCLKSLILMSCSSVGLDGLTSLRCLAHLTLLDLSYTFVTSLEPIFKSCLQLEVLKLQACKYLTDSSLEPLYRKGALPALRELDLSHGSQSRSEIVELLTCCTRLTHVSLSGCVYMHDLDWSVSSCQQSESSSSMISSEDVLQPIEQCNHLLQNLNCVGCPNIKKVVIPVMIRWVHLSSLNLSLSMNLKEVDVACFNLRFLNLNNCSSLEILKLDCPRLTCLFLQSCNIVEEGLEAVISHCSRLETLDIRDCPKIYSVSMGRLRAACPSLKRVFSSFSVL